MNKLLSYDDINDHIQEIKRKGSLVLVGGCFDILHTGHIEFLKQAKKKGDTLLVMLESDESVRQRKGKQRPINTQKERAALLTALLEVDYILLLPTLKSDREYYNLVKTLEPDIIAVTVGDPAESKKAEQAEMVGGTVVEIEHLPEHSTTDLIKDNL